MDGIEGMEPNQIDYDCTILECHVDLDLEGYEDVDDDGEPTGIKIPYVVTLFWTTDRYYRSVVIT